VTLRQRLIAATDRCLGVLIALILGGSVLAFGGKVWWGPVVLAALCGLLVSTSLIRALLEGRARFLKSPLFALGVLAVGLAACQVAPIPSWIAARVSPASWSAYAHGFLPDRARALDASVTIPEAPSVRAPVSIDRPATLRWMAGALACLAVFGVVAQYTDRLSHLYLVWGCVVAAFFLNTGLAAVQLASAQSGLFGVFEPGRGPVFAPSLADMASGPGSTLLRASGESRPGRIAWATPIPERTFSIGSQMGGPGAYLALASIGLPLALGLLLQLMAPRGSREPLSGRLRDSGQGSLVLLIVTMLLASALLCGVLAGPWFAIPLALGVMFAGLPAARATGLRWIALGLSSVLLFFLFGGVALGELWATSTTYPPPVARADLVTSAQVWKDGLAILGDFPLAGSGLGTFGTIYPLYKSLDAASSTAMSSVLQWAVETGLVGMALLGMAGIWCVFRLPGAVRRVGTADRALAFGLIGAATGFILFSTVHWTVELMSVALAASAVAGVGNRWLAGGTDLFVERG
jgi:O-Antigen ligase